ncbi:MAG: TnpV protein [Clostridia bacterium]|nr:TnpV protein [Clostridia bacterium]
MNIGYSQVKDYQIPNIEIGNKEITTMGRFARMRERYLRENKRCMFEQMKMTGTLIPHLNLIQKTCEENLQKIIEQMKQQENITEEMKEKNPMQWVGMMNNLKMTAESMILEEMIYN